MRKKIEFALRRQVMPSNILESLSESFGEEKEFLADTKKPANKSRGMNFGDAIVFTNLVAEALIRDLDLKKGERVILINPDPKDFFLLAIGIMKAGGILIPIEDTLAGEEMKRRSRLGLANIGILDGHVLNRCPDLTHGLHDPGRFLVSGPEVVEDRLPLYTAVAEGSGFFIPYTFKPTSVLALFFSGNKQDAKPVMATAQEFMSGSKILGSLLPLGEGDLALSAAPLTDLGGFCAALTVLGTGARLSFTREREGEGLWAEITGKEPAIFIADPPTFELLADSRPAGNGSSSPRIWFSTAPVSPETAEAFGSYYQLGPVRPPSLFISSLCGPGTSGTAAIQVWAGRRIRGVRLIFPPNRLRFVGCSGQPAARGEVGELLIKGPAVTPGFWNDLEESYQRIRDGWLHTGIDIKR